jgi:hypothetical protein
MTVHRYGEAWSRLDTTGRIIGPAPITDAERLIADDTLGGAGEMRSAVNAR